MIDFKSVIRSHRKVATVITAAFCCTIVGIILTITRPVPDNHNVVSNSPSPISSSVKVRVADIAPSSSSASDVASSKSTAQKVDTGNSALGNAANYKPEMSQPNNEKRSAAKERTSSSQNATSAIAIDRITAPDQINLVIGESQAIDISVAPENATDKKVIWKSSDENIAKVDKTGMIMGVAAGSCTITVKAEDGKVTSSISVAVRTTNN